jgi:hypothetical protein
MRLWRNQAFAVFWSARTISFAGTGITTVVLPVLVYEMTHSPAWVASLGLIEAVPYLSLGLLAGAVADRMNRKKIMVGCDVIAAFLLITVPGAAALHLLGMAQVLIVALGIATVYVWFDAANFGTLPALVDRTELPVAASFIGSSAHRLIGSGGAALRADGRGRTGRVVMPGITPALRRLYIGTGHLDLILPRRLLRRS